MALTHCSECNAQMSDKAGACPNCGAPKPAILPAVPPQAAVAAQQAKLETKFESAGVGCLWQTVGICVVWIFPIGTIIGLALFVYGSSKARYFRCGACKNRLSDKGVTLCPSCGATLK